MKFSTKLWKRSQKSYATTIPHVVLLAIDEKKKYEVVWEYNQTLSAWTVQLQEVEG